MPRIISARNPKYVRADNSAINLDVQLDGLEEWLPFTATPNDPEEHGRTLFQMAVNGDFGDIAAYQEP